MFVTDVEIRLSLTLDLHTFDDLIAFLREPPLPLNFDPSSILERMDRSKAFLYDDGDESGQARKFWLSVDQFKSLKDYLALVDNEYDGTPQFDVDRWSDMAVALEVDIIKAASDAIGPESAEMLAPLLK